MSVETNKNRSKPSNVKSKFFINNEHVTDESLIDFQEKKNCLLGPKPKTRIALKKVKCLKGQKDIRTALKSKKTDLILYSKDFDKICKKSGIDVDSEQLQLAIALSKSLENNQTLNEKIDNNTSSSNRRGKIRSTLQEYGFKIPEVKVQTTRRVKRQNKLYKLLLVSEEEKRQNISNKYSQVLFNSFDNCLDSEKRYVSKSNIFSLSQASHDILVNEDIFNIGLFEKSNNTVGTLFRDWSKIPGRPKSPDILEKGNKSFKINEWTQKEINVILSGSMKNVKELIKHTNKLKKSSNMSVDNNNPTSSNSSFNCDLETSLKNAQHLKSDSNKDTRFPRSISPDIFDDETIVQDISPAKTISNFQSQISYESDMELTECNNFKHLEVNATLSLPFSQGSNITKRKSNDFMEITECVATSDCKNEIIDLTQNIELENVKNITDIVCDTVDLLQSSNSNDETLPFVQIRGSKQNESLEKTIIMEEFEYTHHEALDKNNLEKSCLEVTFVTDNETNNSYRTEKTPCEIMKIVNNSNIDLSPQSFYGDYDYDHSEPSNDNNKNESELEKSAHNSKENNQNESLLCKSLNVHTSYTSLGKKDNISIDYDEISEINIPEKIDLTAECDEDNKNIDQNVSNKFIETYNQQTLDNSNLNEIENISLNNSTEYDNSPKIPSCNSQIESMHKIVLEEEDVEYIDDQHIIGQSEISILKTLSKENKNCLEVLDVICDKKTKESLLKEPLTPLNNLRHCSLSSLDTPQNQYIIKTNEVTPIQDYASMSTPDRNKELDKYGLKPFKRKRAIQLLTHLYNQTHPIVDTSTIEEQFSTKRLKTTDIVDQKTHEPKEIHHSEILNYKQLNVHEVTNDLPELKEVFCNPDEWVFQKKEKAKVSSCRVPLHIAFHNYISCRRKLREAILRYEPVNIDVIYKDLVLNGYKYDAKDLLKFLDRKCITVKMADNSSRNNKRY